MNNIYYQLWIDAIVNAKDYKEKKLGWKVSTFNMITLCNALNLFTIHLWLKLFSVFPYLFEINVFPGDKLDYGISFIIQFASPFIFLNYFLIFHKNRYKKLIRKHKDRKGKLAITYGMSSLVIFFVSLILYSILS